jgi:hypothetical protein
MSDTRVSDPIPATMAYPDPIELPDKFLSHLQSLELEVATLIFQHFQTRPLQAADGRLDTPSTQEWCERMDNLLVSKQLLLACYILTVPRESSAASREPTPSRVTFTRS